MHAFLVCAAILVLAGCAEAGVTGTGRVRQVSLPVRAPTPEESEAYAATLPPCALPDLSVEAWPEVANALPNATLHLPAGYRASAEPEMDSLRLQAFTSEADSAALFLRLLREPEGSPNFALAIEDAEPVQEGRCALGIAGRLAPLVLLRLVQPQDTSFAAVADVVLEPALFLGAGVLARSRTERERLLVALTHLHMREPLSRA